jgi:hypothetical protein
MSSDESEEEIQEPKKTSRRSHQSSSSSRGKVGRPKKQIPRRDIVNEGIVRTPCNADSASDEQLVYSMRLLYENPGMFKNIFNLLRSMGIVYVHAKFEPECIRMFTDDEDRNKGKSSSNRIYIVINGNRMNSYYCEKPLEMGFSVDNLIKKLQSLHKEVTEIEITTTRKWETEHLCINLHNETTSMRNESIIKVDKPSIQTQRWESVEEDLSKEKSYPIRFEMSYKAFKQAINNISVHLKDKQTFTIEKTGLENLRFHFPYENSLGSDSNIFEDHGKINLISNVEDDEPFAASVQVSNIKLLTGTLITDTIGISVDEQRDLIFTMLLDQMEDRDKKLIPGSESAYIKVLMNPPKPVQSASAN